MTPAEIMRKARDPSFWREQVPELTIGSPPQPALQASRNVDSARSQGIVPTAQSLTPAGKGGAAARYQLLSEGWAVLPNVVPREVTLALATGIRRLHTADIPPLFVFVFDEAWSLAASLGPTFDALLGAPAGFLPDVWAWFVPSREGARGWAPHRGVVTDVRNATGEPTLVNAWIALSDVTEANACMYVVPLKSDPHYPGALKRTDVDVRSAAPLAMSAGDLAVWNANVLHWGGAMTTAAPARLSLSFSIQAGSERLALSRDGMPPFDARIDLVADMLLTYHAVAGVEGPWLEWGRLWSGMRDMRR